jgi:hypothetical protein
MLEPTQALSDRRPVGFFSKARSERAVKRNDFLTRNLTRFDLTTAFNLPIDQHIARTTHTHAAATCRSRPRASTQSGRESRLLEFVAEGLTDTSSCAGDGCNRALGFLLIAKF